MSKNQDFYAERVNRFVALAPCIFIALPNDYELEVARYQYSDYRGIHNFFGGDQGAVSSFIFNIGEFKLE